MNRRDALIGLGLGWLVLTTAAAGVLYMTYIRSADLAPNPVGALFAIDLTFAANAGALSAVAGTRMSDKLVQAIFVAVGTLVFTPIVDAILVYLMLRVG